MKCIICGSSTKLFVNNLFDDRYGAPDLYSVYKCKKCGFGRTDPVLPKNKIGEFYKKYYPLSNYKANNIKASAKVWNKYLAWLIGIDNIAHWKIASNSNVLDIGSGSGQSLLEIKILGASAYGVEPDPSAQEIAKKLNLNVFKGFLSDNPFPKIRFDYITGSQVIEHEPDPLKFLKIAKNKLNKNGKIILSFPNFDSVYRKIYSKKWINWHIPYHINFFDNKSLSSLVKQAGLKIVEFKTITPNIWSVIQFKILFTNSVVGTRNKIWGNNPISIGARIVNIILFMIFIPINRLFDSLEMGDSILVILEK